MLYSAQLYTQVAKQSIIIPTTELYFEAHITVEPMTKNGEIDRFVEVCQPFDFRVAKFLLFKTPHSSPDAFCTGRSKDYNDISRRMNDCITVLNAHGFIVKRYKIENTLVDVHV